MKMFEVVNASINTQEAVQAYAIDAAPMSWPCVCSIMAVIAGNHACRR